ncbi:hypothetical protein A4A49_23161, partial [Nicotiana attenuata]
MKTVPRDLFNISDQYESDVPYCYENEPYENSMSPSIPNDDGEVVLVRSDVPATIIDVPPEGYRAQEAFLHSISATLHSVSAFSAFLHYISAISAFLHSVSACLHRVSAFSALLHSVSAFLHSISANLHSVSAFSAFLHSFYAFSAFLHCVSAFSAFLHIVSAFSAFSAFLHIVSAFSAFLHIILGFLHSVLHFRVAMNAGAKKKGLNPNKAQSPMKKIGFDFQFRSSAELAKQFQIKKEKLAHDKEHRIVKEQAPVTHKRKHLMPTISNAREGQSRQRLIQPEESFQQQGNGKLPMHKSIIQLSSKEALNTSHMIGRKQGEGEICKKVKRKPVLSATSLDHFLEKNGIYVGGEKQPDNQPVDGFRSMPSPLVDEHNIELDDFAAQEVGEDECVRDKAMDVDSTTGGTSDKKKVRGQTKCKMIHARNFEERQEVAFDKGQAVGPTGKRVSELSNFIGTIARNPRFITLLFTSWHAVADDIKQRMWEYVNRKERNGLWMVFAMLG